MKICMPTLGAAGYKEKLYNHFGSAEFFTIYDTEKKELKVVENNNFHHEHGTCQPMGVIEKEGIQIVLTGGMGRRAVALLNQGGVKVYIMEGETVEDAISKYEAGELHELTMDMACGGHGCH